MLDGFDILIKKIRNNKLLMDVIIATTIIGFIAHSFIFYNPFYGHDNTGVAFERIYDSAIRTRWLQSFFFELTNFTNTTVVSGVICLVILIVSIYQILDIFEIKSTAARYIIAGIVVTNPAITNANFYEMPYVIIMALPFSTTAVWICKKSKNGLNIKTMLLSAFFVMLTAATYGAYVSVFTTLVCLLVVLDIYNGKSIKENLESIFKYIAIFSIGIVTYYIVLRISLLFFDMNLQTYAGEDSLTKFVGLSSYIYGLTRGYVHFFYYILGLSIYQYVPRVLSIILIVTGIWFAIVILRKKKVHVRNIVLLVSIVFIFPLIVNMIWIMSAGHTHHLMYFPFALIYIFCVKECEYALNLGIEVKRISTVFVAFAVLFVFYGMILSNTIYVKIDNMYTRTQSISTRLVDRIECNYTGTEDVVLVGYIYGFTDYFAPEYEKPVGITNSIGISATRMGNTFDHGQFLIEHLKNITGANLNYIQCSKKEELVDIIPELTKEDIDAIDAMQSFPASNSVIKIGNHIIVYLYYED